jgi:hypothetical protein
LASTASSAVLTRHWGKDTALIAFNNSMQTQTHTFKTPTALKGQQGRMWWGAGKVQVEGQNMTVTIQPLSGWIWGASSQAK